MRIDAGFNPDLMRADAATASGQAADLPLMEGDRVQVRVLANEDGTVRLKTDDGQIFQARLEGGVQLPPGARTTLVVTGREDGVIYMALDRLIGRPSGIEAPVLQQMLSDKTLAACARQLQSMRLPVTEETVRLMAQIRQADPDVPLPKAAFFAANHIPAEPALLQAADGLLAGEPTITQMLETLLSELTAGGGTAAPAAGGAAAGGQAAAAGQAAWSDWIGVLTEALAADGGEGAPEQAADAASGRTSEASNPAPVAGMPADVPVRGAVIMDAPAAGQADAAPPAAGESVAAGEMAAGGEANPAGGTTAPPREAPLPDRTPPPGPAAEQQAPLTLQRTVFALLSQMPAMRELPERSVAGLSEALARAVTELGADGAADPEKLSAFLRNMIARVNREDPEAGAQLKKARDELAVRLAVFEEAVARSSLPGRAALLEQTGRAADQMRLMAGVDQFVYMQLPVQINRENKTADLYIYKNRKQKGRIDPDNVSILLALDLSHMGHLESLIAIRGKEVSLKMETDESGISAFVRQNTALLHRLLDEAGFKLGDVRVSEAAAGKEETTAATALRVLYEHERDRAARGGVDIKI